MLRILEILYRNGFDGVVIPDHVPEMACDASWHAGMAHAIGWIKGTLAAIERYNPR
jgi:mannonate dehydratase